MKYLLIVYLMSGSPVTWGTYDTYTEAEAEKTYLYDKFKRGLNGNAYKRYTFSRCKTYNCFKEQIKIQEK